MNIHISQFLLTMFWAMTAVCSAAAEPHDINQFAQYVAWNEGNPYTGQCVVRVRTTSQSQLDRVIEVATDVWSERIGQGPLEIQIEKSALSDLAAIGVPYDILIDDLQAHIDESAADMIQTRQRLQLARPDGYQRGGMIHDDEWFSTYRTLEEITAYCENIESLRPDMATIETIGQSWEGRDMFSITISGPDTETNPIEDRPALFIFSTVHAREWIAPMTTTYIASKLVSDYDADQYVQGLLDQARIVIVPVGNPDGYLYTWSNERFWRNTRRDNGDGSYGVNINRNWGYQWGGQGSSGSTTSTNYRGTNPFSEPETKALRDVALGLGDKLVAHIDYHSYSQLVLWPYGFDERIRTPEPYDSVFEHVAQRMADTINKATGAYYDPMQAVDLYPAAGDSSDWFFGHLDRMSYTYELRPSCCTFSPASSQIYPCATENFESFKVLIEESAQTIRLIHSPLAVTEGADQSLLALHWFTGPQSKNVVVELHSRTGGEGAYTKIAMERASEVHYQGLLEPSDCGETVEYFFQVTHSDGAVTELPELGPAAPFETRMSSRAYYLLDNFETEKNWVRSSTDTATSGFWERAIPEQTSHQPGSDHSFDGELCWVTGAAAGESANDNDVDGGSTTLISPRFSSGNDTVLSFWYWQVHDGQVADISGVYISNDDGATWTWLEYLRSDQPSRWTRVEYRIADHIEPTHVMRVRFRTQDVNQDHTIELAIDDFAVGEPGCPINAADLDADGSLDVFDVSLFIEFYQAMSISADFNGDGSLNFFDVAEYLRIFTGQ